MVPTLHHVLIAPEHGAPRALTLFAHGILGRGANLRAVARRFVRDRGDGMGAVLVDLRMHGASQGFPAPHGIVAAAADLSALEGSLPAKVTAIVGHSLGGKIALVYAGHRRERTPLDEVFVLDSMPGARGDGAGPEHVEQIVDMLASLPRHFPTRRAFTDAVRARGEHEAIAEWLATNLERRPDGFVLRLDLLAIRALLADHFETDAWPMLEAPGPERFVMIVGGRSPAFGAGDRERLARAAAASEGRIRVVTLAEAGHWVHVDDFEGVARAMTGSGASGPLSARLPRS